MDTDGEDAGKFISSADFTQISADSYRDAEMPGSDFFQSAFICVNLRINRQPAARLPQVDPRGKLPLMPTVALRAHYDGERIILDEPYDLPANSSLMVTVLPLSQDGESEENWLRSAVSSDAFAFLADPAEDIYAITDGKPFCDAR